MRYNTSIKGKGDDAVKITIEGTKDEIAALVLAIQERQSADVVIEEINRRALKAEHSPLLA